MSNSNSFRNPDYPQIPTSESGVPTTNASRVINVVDRQDELRKRARRRAIDEARPNFLSDPRSKKMTWDIFNDSFLLLRAFGNSIELTFSEGEEREEPYDLGAVPGLKKMSEGIRTRHPNYHLQSGSLHSAITIRRAQGTTSVQEAPSKAIEKGLDALEQASEETDTLVVDALLSGHSSAVGVRYAESGKGDVFRTQFFHSRPFADVEADFLNWIQSSLENEVFERRRQGEDFSSLQKPIASFGKALEQSDLEVSVTGGEEELSYRIRAFASCL